MHARSALVSRNFCHAMLDSQAAIGVAVFGSACQEAFPAQVLPHSRQKTSCQSEKRARSNQMCELGTSAASCESLSPSTFGFGLSAPTVTADCIRMSLRAVLRILCLES